MSCSQAQIVKTLSVYLTRTADKSQKKLDKPLRIQIRNSLQQIAADPESVGERLTTPLTGVYSHHIKYKGKEFRIAYMINPDSECVVILLIGPHENFYRRLKQVVDAAC